MIRRYRRATPEIPIKPNEFQRPENRARRVWYRVLCRRRSRCPHRFDRREIIIMARVTHAI